jgi:Fatty acid desaturase
MAPMMPVIAVGIWWNSNTIAHIFIHRPFFRSAAMNRLFSAAQSLLLGIPQTLWRDRHLAHHAGRAWRLRMSRRLAIETTLVIGLWVILAAQHPRFFWLTYVPGYLAGLGLCALQGHWEHAEGRPVSHYGRIYNWLCFNDGYHAEHHAAPSLHWAALPGVRARTSAARPLEVLERVVLASPRLQRFLLMAHRKAFERLLPQLGPISRVMIVGGGLFPRTALILRELLPGARIVIVDSCARNLEIASTFLGASVEYRHERFVPGESSECDLAVIPLCFQGDRAAVYRYPPCPAILVHDWIWHLRGSGAIVSMLLLKRINLIRADPRP